MPTSCNLCSNLLHFALVRHALGNDRIWRLGWGNIYVVHEPIDLTFLTKDDTGINF
jgi:hypothetical protein